MDTLAFLSDSSTDSSNSESDNEENIAAQNLQAAFQEKIAQKANASQQLKSSKTDSATAFTAILTSSSVNSTKSTSLPLTKPQKVKKRPPAPEDFSKLLGIPINEAPKNKIKKLSDVSNDRFEKRAKELENKYSCCFEETSAPVHRAIQNPYDIDDMDFSEVAYSQENALQNTTKEDNSESHQSLPKSLRISKMVAADWASSVAPPTEDLFSEPPEQSYQSNSYEEYNKKKNGYSSRDRLNNSKHRHRQDKKSYHDKRYSRDWNLPHLKHTATQCSEGPLFASIDSSTQTSSADTLVVTSPTSSDLEKLNKPDYYKSKADDMKKILSLMSDPVSTLIVRLKLSLLQVQEVVAMMSYRLAPSSICHHINPIILACRKNLEEIKKLQEVNSTLKDALTVINMKLMAYLYHQIYIVRRDEIAKAKVILDAFIMRNDVKAMAARELSCMKMYVMHMEYFAKSFNYVERSNLVIKNSKSDFFERHGFKELYPMNSIFRHVSTISSALIEANRIHDDEAP